MKIIRQIATGHDPIGECFEGSLTFGAGRQDTFSFFGRTYYKGSRVWATLFEQHAWSACWKSGILWLNSFLKIVSRGR